MAKALLAFYRDGRSEVISRGDIENLARRLTPDNINISNLHVRQNEGHLLFILNSGDGVIIKDFSTCLGLLFEEKPGWWQVGNTAPDGSYAIFRCNEEKIEIASDMVSSRSIWYYIDEDKFLVSTSQRAIIYMLKNFRFNQQVIPWMLSTGTLGPELSWDERIRILKPDSILHLDKRSWQIKVSEEECQFAPAIQSHDEYKRELLQALKETFSSISVDYSRWHLPLSGGFDSRLILSLIHRELGVKCITWGLKSSLDMKYNDAAVARQLADHYKVAHQYYETDLSDEPVSKLFGRFLTCGEGRIDHISGYMDGFQIWRTLYDSGVTGVIRGDEGFGWSPVGSALDVRDSIGLMLLTDFMNLHLDPELGLREQSIPDYLKRNSDESLATWRDRLYHQFRIPVILAALNDLKCSYVEIANPLLSKRILRYVRMIPDELRTDKILFKEIVRSMAPDIDFARYPAVANPKDILKQQPVVKLLKDELEGQKSDHILSKELVSMVISQMVIKDTTQKVNRGSFKDRAKKFVPSGLIKVIKKKLPKPCVDFNILAFRLYIIGKMYQMLKDDAFGRQ
jgi:hypothetical protein